MTRRMLAAAILIGLTTVAAPPSSDAAATFHPGAADLGDALAPGLGNGGYTVSHYRIALNYHPNTGMLVGTTTLNATLTENLSRFDLDFALPANSVTVNGISAAFRSVNGPDFSFNRDLVVTPQQGLPAGSQMTVVVTYRARPATVMLDGLSEWSTTPTGVMVWDEPTAAAQWWYPGNDYPSDKASYDVTITTPQELTAVTNGRLLSRAVHGTTATAHWRSTDPIASHVTVLVIGRYSVDQGTVLNGVPSYYAYEDNLGVLTDRARKDVERTPEVLSFLQSKWGPYPFAAAGGIVVGFPFPSALETQTRPVYESGLWQNQPDNLWAVVHENAHMWFGDSVSMSTWRDIWLAEGFATYSEWVWSQAHGQGSAEQLFLATYAEHPASDSFWATPLNQPDFPLASPAYQRGAMLLQALRNRVGSTAFAQIMRAWTTQHRHGNASTADFEALAATISGQNLASFFSAWVDAPQRPAPTKANGFPRATRAALSAGQVTAPASAAAISRSDAMIWRTRVSSLDS
jgi:aminopeptidase N